MTVPSRAVFLHFAAWQIAVFYFIAFATIGVFLYGVYCKIQRYRRGAPAPRLDRLARRFWAAELGVAASQTVGKGDPYVGVAHALMAWGWMFLLLGTALVAIDEDVVGLLAPQYKFLRGPFYLGFSLVLDLAGLGFIAGLIMMGRRRAGGLIRLDYTRVDRPAGAYDRRPYTREDRLFLAGLLAIAVTGFLTEAARVAVDFPAFEVWSPVGWLLGKGLAALGAQGQAALALHKPLWWLHALLAMALLARLVTTKAQHMLTSFAGLMVRDPLAARRLPPAQVRPGQAHAGVKTLTDMNWAELLMLDACTRCGRCHEACPARGQGAPLSPRDLILDLRECQDLAAVLPGGRIAAGTLWACTTCRACVVACPAGIEHVPMIVQMRRQLVEAGQMDENVQSTLMKLSRQGNSMGQPARLRGRWAQGLEFPVKDARKEAVEYLWFVGDYASYDPRLTEVTRTVARVFQQAGLDFGILYDGERNSGNDVRRVGEEGLFEVLAEHNIGQLRQAQFRRIVTTDPHSYNTLRFEYPDLAGTRWEVVHYTEVLAELLASGRLPVRRPLGRKVTYHDPCYLGRYAGIYDSPRRVLAAIGCEVVEMPRCRDNSYCCGAGGGRIWSGDSLYPGEKPAESRVREALALGGVDTFVVACPKDMAMYTDAVKSTGNDGKLQVVDMIQLVAAAIARPEVAAVAAGHDR